MYKKTSIKNLDEIEYFDGHTETFELDFSKHGIKGYISLHRSGSDLPAFGATRIWHYDSQEDALAEALQLAKLMSYKAALAGISYGGAKAVINIPSDVKIDKRALLKLYAQAVDELAGQFVTGADVGLSAEDVAFMQGYSNHFVGISRDPVYYTALGIYHSIKSVLKELYGNESISGRSIAIQGLGKIGTATLTMILEEEPSVVYVSDPRREAVDAALIMNPVVKAVGIDDINHLEVDIFSPCALSHVINERSLSELRCKAIVGGANNQLSKAELASELYQKGIIYAPDYVVNAGGLISVVNEYDQESESAIQQKVINIGETISQLINQSNKEKVGVLEAANRKGKALIEALVI